MSAADQPRTWCEWATVLAVQTLHTTTERKA